VDVASRLKCVTLSLFKYKDGWAFYASFNSAHSMLLFCRTNDSVPSSCLSSTLNFLPSQSNVALYWYSVTPSLSPSKCFNHNPGIVSSGGGDVCLFVVHLQQANHTLHLSNQSMRPQNKRGSYTVVLSACIGLPHCLILKSWERKLQD
jgi:hypothetical protein